MHGTTYSAQCSVMCVSIFCANSTFLQYWHGNLAVSKKCMIVDGISVTELSVLQSGHGCTSVGSGFRRLADKGQK